MSKSARQAYVEPGECEAGTKTTFDLVSICTEHNLTDYKLAPPRKGGVQFVLTVITNMREAHGGGASEPSAGAASVAPGRKTFMVERIQTIELADVKQCQRMLAKLAYVRRSSLSEPEWRSLAET